MPREQSTLRVGDTSLLTYTIKDDDAEVDVTAATLSIHFTPPSGGTASTGTPVLRSGEVAVIEFQAKNTSGQTITFNAPGLWIVAVRAVFAGGLQYESTVDKITVEASQF